MTDDIKINLMQRLIILVACAMILIGFSVKTAGATVPGERSFAMVTENYTVQAGDTLDKITEVYIKKNTWGKREFSEFRFGIQELNPQLFERDVMQGETLIINYWIDIRKKE